MHVKEAAKRIGKTGKKFQVAFCELVMIVFYIV